jgi:hypothetical protein
MKSFDHTNAPAPEDLVQGRQVKVVRAVRPGDPPWGDLWIEEMDRTIGHIYLVEGTPYSNYRGLKVALTAGFNYPIFCLELV